MALAAGVIATKRPTLAEAVCFKSWDHRLEIAGRIRRQVVEMRIVNPTAGILDVPRIITEPAQGDEIMKELVSHPCQGVPEQDAKDDNPAFSWFGRFHRCGSAESLWRDCPLRLCTAGHSPLLQNARGRWTLLRW